MCMAPIDSRMLRLVKWVVQRCSVEVRAELSERPERDRQTDTETERERPERGSFLSLEVSP